MGIETEMMSKIILTLCVMAAVATATGPCKKDGDCQTDGDMSAYCKDNNDCHCSAPHFNNADDTCKLACSPGDASNACCRDDADCQANGDTGGYCKTLRGYNPGNGECRCDAGFSGTTSCKKSAVAVEVSRMAPASSLKLCSPCIQLSEQGLNILLNEILNVGVVGGCNKLCSGLKKKGSQTVCNLICDVVGMKTFVKVLNSTDLDPIYFCEELGACPKGSSRWDLPLEASLQMCRWIRKTSTLIHQTLRTQEFNGTQALTTTPSSSARESAAPVTQEILHLVRRLALLGSLTNRNSCHSITRELRIMSIVTRF